MISLTSAEIFDAIPERKRKRVYLLMMLLKKHPELLPRTSNETQDEFFNVITRFIEGVSDNQTRR